MVIIYRCTGGFETDSHGLRTRFTEYMFSNLGKGTFYRQMNYRELKTFLEESFRGLQSLIQIIKIAKKERNRSTKEARTQNDEELARIGKKIHFTLFGNKERVKLNTLGIEKPIEIFSESGVRYVDLGRYRFVEQNPDKDSLWAEGSSRG